MSHQALDCQLLDRGWGYSCGRALASMTTEKEDQSVELEDGTMTGLFGEYIVA